MKPKPEDSSGEEEGLFLKPIPYVNTDSNYSNNALLAGGCLMMIAATVATGAAIGLLASDAISKFLPGLDVSPLECVVACVIGLPPFAMYMGVCSLIKDSIDNRDLLVEENFKRSYYPKLPESAPEQTNDYTS